jgi:hypothetical protein
MAKNIVDCAAYGFITDDELLYAIMGEAECSRHFTVKILEMINLETKDFHD